MFRDWGELGNILMTPSLIPIFPSHQQNRGVYLAVLESCPEWEQFLGENAQKWKKKKSFGTGSKAEISFCWGNVLDSDNDLRICGLPTRWATRWGGGTATALDLPRGLRAVWWSDQRKRWTCKWTGRGQTGGCGGCGGNPATRLAFRRAMEGCWAALWLSGVCRALSLLYYNSHWKSK